MKRALSFSASLLAAVGFAISATQPAAWAAAAAHPNPPIQASNTTDSGEAATRTTIPGPLPGFLRMAGIGQATAIEDILPVLARNVITLGYNDLRGKDRKPTEFLILLQSYLRQAKALQALAGPDGSIRINKCSELSNLLPHLGYALGQPCGPEAKLVTVDSRRAFLTLDSGFPLVDLEEAIRGGKPFSTPFADATVPVLFHPGYISGYGKKILDSLLDEPETAWLYWSLSKLDEDTRTALQKSPGFRALVPLAPVLDFYGSHLVIRTGRVEVPGGSAAWPAWESLVGASPGSPAEFIPRLLQKDAGWLAAYYDVLARLPQTQRGYFTEPRRLMLFYQAMQVKEFPSNSANSTFRPAPGLFLLASSLRFDPDGEPHIPGGLEVWKSALQGWKGNAQVRNVIRRSRNWNRPQQMIEAMFALARISDDNSPLRAFLLLSELDGRRSAAQRLSSRTMGLLLSKFRYFDHQYPLFVEWNRLDNESVVRFLTNAETLDSIKDPLLRENAIGIFQASLGLWQIMARQEEIPGERQNESWKQVIQPFSEISTTEQLLTATQASLAALFLAAGGKPRLSQDELIALLAGPQPADGPAGQMRQNLANRIRAVMTDQGLVSLDVLFQLMNSLEEMEQGKEVSSVSLAKSVGALRSFEAPKSLFSNMERTNWAPGLAVSSHLTLQTGSGLAKIFMQAPVSSSQRTKARGLLTHFLRDVLVGLNYAYYEPPGAQMLHSNPLFVRLHSFSEPLTSRIGGAWRRSRMLGQGESAGWGARLSGTLLDLPYGLAIVEQDFIVPKSIQALIWTDLVPSFISGAVLPRWWRVTPNEMHALSLYQRLGEELVTAAGGDAELRRKVIAIYSDRMYPQWLGRLENAIRNQQVTQALASLTPSETFHLAVEFLQRYPEEWGSRGRVGEELAKLLQQFPEETSRQKISRDFGVPHPGMGQSYSCELLGIRLSPSFLGYSSRLLAETWESNNLYWARLADEKGYSPLTLHELVPALTHRLVENIDGTHFDDWRAILSALRQTGKEFQQGDIRLSTASTVAGEARY